MNIPDVSVPRVVIVGGGFAGINLAKKLKNKDFQVVLLDRNNFHNFQPLLYQVATAGLEPDSIAYPLRKLFAGQNRFHFRLAEVKRIDQVSNVISTNIGDLRYDYLVLATGSTTNFFGMGDVAQHAMGMKSVSEALDIRSLVLQNFEKAHSVDDLQERMALLNIVIVGGGPTGVEMAGALAELKRHVLPKDYPDLDVKNMEIHLIEASDRLLAAMSQKSGDAAQEFLDRLGVHVWTNTQVSGYDGTVVQNNKSKQLRSKTLIWAAGVQGAPVAGIQADQIVGGKRIHTDATNAVIGTENIYAVGDVAAILDENTPKGHPMVAQVAIQQALHLAKNLAQIQKGKDTTPFRYKDLGSMATIGRNKAVVDLPKWKFKGLFAWIVWMFIHIRSLIGFRNKLVTLINWVYNYFHYAKDIRLIIRPFKRSDDSDKKTKTKVLEKI